MSSNRYAKSWSVRSRPTTCTSRTGTPRVGSSLRREEVTGFDLFEKFLTARDEETPVPEVVSEVEKSKREGPFRYNYLSPQLREKVDAILRGKLPLADCPELPARITRMFVSCTATDMIEERNYLMKKIYPKLKTYCRERHGIDFQIVDLRFNTTFDEGDFRRLIDMSVEEIYRSHQLSLGPFFASFVGQRYGPSGLPSIMPKSVHDAIYRYLKERTLDPTLVITWYTKDINATPNRYVLQSPYSILGDRVEQWGSIREQLYRSLVEICWELVQSDDTCQRFLEDLTTSAVHQEIREAIGRQGSLLCFERTIADIDEYLDRDEVYKYVDLEPNSNEISKGEQGALAELRHSMLYPGVPSENIYRKHIMWCDLKGVDPHNAEHAEYLENMGGFFYERVRSIVDQYQEDRPYCLEDGLYDEVIQHWTAVKHRCETFRRREDTLDQIRNYLLDSCDRPLVIIGESGIGKTDIMSKASTLVQGWMAQAGRCINTSVIVRQCGLTPSSTHLRPLLDGLNHQMAYATEGHRHLLPTDFGAIKRHFRQVVQAGEFRGFVVLFLDGLEQLSRLENAHLLDWLPAHMSNNVKIVLSTRSGPDNPILARLRQKIVPEEQYLEVKEFTKHNCTEFLDLLLRREGRSVSFHQGRAVREALARCASPLYVKLTFEDARHWHSDLDVDAASLCAGVNEGIIKVLADAETGYGETLVSHTLAFLTASQGGISECELEDLLSLDDVVLNGLYDVWEPALRRIPPVTVLRILDTLWGFLTQVNIDETTVYYWYHPSLTDMARSRYLGDETSSVYVHDIMADYYLGRWCGTLKRPFKYTKDQVKRLRKIDEDGAACRFVPAQPLVFTTHNTHQRFNFRKLNCLPFHLVGAKRTSEVCDLVYFNYEWLRTKLQACGTHSVIADYSLVNSQEVVLVSEALRMSESALSEDVKVLAMELTGRLLPHYGKPYIRKLLDRCDLAAIKECPVVPAWQVYYSPGAPLQYPITLGMTLKNDLDMFVVETPDDTLLGAKPYDARSTRLWDLSGGEPLRSLPLSSGSRVYPTPNGQYLCVFRDSRYVQTYYTHNGDLYGELEYGFGAVHQVAVSNRYVAFTIEQQTGPVLVDIEAKLLLQRFNYPAKTVALSADNACLACNHGHGVAYHELPLLERKCLTQFESLPEKIMFSRDPLKFYVQCQSKELTAVRVNIPHKRADKKTLSRDLEMQTFSLSHNGLRLMLRASRALFLYDTTTDKQVQHIHQVPPGVVLDDLSVYRDAAFSADDSLLVAARHSYLVFWDATSGQAVRVLQPSVCPITRIFTPASANQAITLLQDLSVQVWNLDDLDSDVWRTNAVLRGPVTSMAVAPAGDRVVISSNHRAEAMTLSIETGKYERSVEHTPEGVGVIRDLLMSPSGRFAVTRMANADVLNEMAYWEELNEDKLWDLETGDLVHAVPNNRHVTFSANDSRLVFFHCRNYCPLDWVMTSYDAIILDVSAENQHDGYVLELPDGDLVGRPVIAGDGDFMIFIHQMTQGAIYPGSDTSSYGYDSSMMSGPLHTQSDIVLCVYSFEKQWHGLNYATVQNLWQGANDDDKFIHCEKVSEDTLMLLFGRGMTYYGYRDDGTLDRSRQVEKGCILYDVRQTCVLQRFDSFLSRGTNLDSLVVSSHGAVMIDDKLQVFDAVSGRFIKRLDLEDIAKDHVILLMDGKYMATFSSKRTDVKIYRSNDGVLKASFPVHGLAKTMGVASDDRTLVIGCHDGRVMMLAVVLDEADPVRDVIKKLPSRANCQFVFHRTLPGLRNYVMSQDSSYLRPTFNELRQRSTSTRRKIENNIRKPANFKTLDAAAKFTSELSKVRSQACSIM